MNLSKLKLLTIFIIFSACTPIGHKFCIGNGYLKDTPQYEQCTMRYSASRDLYKYCSTQKGLVQDNPQLNQCVESARLIKDEYTQDSFSCQRDADTKFGAFLSQGKREKQPSLHLNGTVSLDEVSIDNKYNSQEVDSYIKPYLQSCLQIYGWNNADSWQDGKMQNSLASITSRLSSLNQEAILISIPENPIARLFKAVSDGNTYLVRDIITKENIPVNSQNYQGYSALHVAAKQGNFQIVRMLIEELNADTDLRSVNGEKAIDMAAQSPNRSLVGYITDTFRKKDEKRIRDEEQQKYKQGLNEIKKAIEQQKQETHNPYSHAN